MITLAAAPSRAVEPAREFLEGLRARGYFEQALDYLDSMENSPLAPTAFKRVVDYERGVTLIKGASRQHDFALRGQQLDQAQEFLKKFLENDPQSELVASANSQLGNVIVERARMKIEQSKKPEQGNTAQLLNEARKLFEEAEKVFSNSKEQIVQELEKLPRGFIDPKREPEKHELRERLRADYVQVQIVSAAVLEEKAETAAEGTEDYKKLLTDAANAYNEIYEKYRTRLAGLYAEMYQGRCYLKMKDYKEALTYFNDLLEQPDSPASFRELKTKAMMLAMDCWLAPSMNQYAEAVTKGGGWLDKASPSESREGEWLALRLSVAQAHKAMAEDLPENDPQRARSLKEARDLARFVARYPGDTEKVAQKLLADIGDPRAASNGDRPEPTTFADAKEAGNEARDVMSTSDLLVRNLQRSLASAKTEQEKADIQKQIDEAKKKSLEARQDAVRYYRMALGLATPDDSLDQINIVRYFLTYFYYVQDDYYKAAVLSEFLARRYPSAAGARPAGKIGLACYTKLYNTADPKDREFEEARLMGMAEYLNDQWPDQAEGIEALGTLIPFFIRRDELDRAVTALEKIPEESSARGDAELRVGQALYGALLRKQSDLEKLKAAHGADAVAQQQEALDQQRAQAEKVLSAGVARKKEAGQLSSELATAILSMAQIYVDTGRPQEAIDALQDSKFGALTLVAKNAPSVQRAGFAESTYKTALQAYIAAMPTAEDPARLNTLAKAVMGQLKRVVGETASGKQRLVAIYYTLARKLQNLMTEADPQTRDKLSQGFDTFLSQVTGEAADYTVVNWVAETYYGMAQGIGAQGGSTSKAKPFYDKANANFEKILSMSNVPDNVKTQVRMRLAFARREAGEFDKAVDDLVAILKTKKMNLTAQIELAKTYQQWAQTDKSQTQHFRTAITGVDPKRKLPRDLVWGWSGLARRTSKPEYLDYFHTARYNAALAQYSYGKAKNSEKELKKAEQYITLTEQVFPDMGGEQWRERYDKLLKSIQTSLKKKPTGLKEPA